MQFFGPEMCWCNQNWEVRESQEKIKKSDYPQNKDFSSATILKILTEIAFSIPGHPTYRLGLFFNLKTVDSIKIGKFENTKKK